MRLAKRLAFFLLLPPILWLAALAFPQPLFAYSYSHGQYDVWSDRPIPPEIRTVLDDVTRRIQRSELYSPDQRFRIFFCNDDWRMALYSQRFTSAPGGVADTWLTRNIYIRRSDIAANRLFPPAGELADAPVRPLSYFIAHEAVHVMDSRAFGRLSALRNPSWLREGYADYVGKGGAFDFEENRALLATGDPLLDPAGMPGIYRRHHLLVAYLLDREGMSVRQAYADPPDEDLLVRRLRQSLNGPQASGAIQPAKR